MIYRKNLHFKQLNLAHLNYNVTPSARGRKTNRIIVAKIMQPLTRLKMPYYNLVRGCIILATDYARFFRPR
jgi:hypothetical protein